MITVKQYAVPAQDGRFLGITEIRLFGLLIYKKIKEHILRIAPEDTKY